MKRTFFNKYLLLCVIFTFIGFGVLFAIHGLYPFGSKSINMLDFDSGYIPAYYKLWDVLHFQSPLFFDWNLGTGLNSFGSLIGNGFISPLCWIIGLFPRHTIPYTIAYVYFAKMIFTSMMMYLAITLMLPKTKEKNKILFTLLYTFSGWTFLMSTNLLYLDAFSIFPLLVYSLKKLLDTGKWKLYTVLLTLTLILNYYIAWLDLLFIIVTTGLYLLIMRPANCKEKAVKVLVFTLLSLLLSCIIFLPGFMFAKVSTRMANNTSNDGILAYFMDKSIYLFTLAIPLVLTIKQLFVKKDKRLNRFIIALLSFLLIGVVIEPINALWHTGSHSGFPFRYAYQPTFIAILVSLYYLNKNYKPKEKTSNYKLIIPILLIGLAFGIFIKFYEQVIASSTFVSYITTTNDYLIVLSIFIILTIAFIFILSNDRKKAFILTILLFWIQTIIYGSFYMYQFMFSTSVSTQKILDSFELENDNYNYVFSGVMNWNTPYILKVSSMTNRIHFIRQEFQDEVDYFGYNRSSQTNTVIYSSGSNEFFNILMQNKYYLVDYELPNSIYKRKDSQIGYNYYESKYYIPYLVTYNGKEYNKKDLDMANNANNAYKELFDGEKNIYNEVEYKKDNNSITVKVKKNHVYYVLFDTSELKGYTTELHNDAIKQINWHISDISNNYVFYATDDIKYTFTFNFDYDNVKIYELNENELAKFVDSQKNNNVSVEIDGITKKYTFNALEDTAVLLPINYDDNYTVKVNGKVVEYKCNLYNMLSINVKKGKNVIEVTYNQKWLKTGTKISIITLLAFLLLYFINKRFRFLNYKIILWPLFIISLLCFIFFIIKVYILSWI